MSSVGVTVDGGALLPLTNTGGITWSAPLVLDQGVHHLEVIAADGAGNTTAPVSVDVDLDTEPPLLTIAAPDDGSCLGEPITIEFSADDPHLDEVTATVNGAVISTGHVVDTDGDYVLMIAAIDSCGEQTIDERQFIIDTATPEITITGLNDDQIYAIGTPAEWSATDDHLDSVTALLDGTPVDPSFTVDTVGAHLLEITAEDCAGNTTDRDLAFVTVLPDDGVVGSVIADPTQIEPPGVLQAMGSISNTIATDYTDLSLRLEVIDPSTGNVFASHEAVADLPSGSSVDIEYAFATDALPLGGYELEFSASGVVYGNGFDVTLASTTFEIVDLTPPVLVILAPMPGLACEPIEVRVTATDELAGVEVVRMTVDDDPVGLPLTHIGGDTWTATPTLSENVHHLEIVAIDGAVNESEPAAVDIDLDLTPPVLVVGAPVTGECLSTPVTITFSAVDEHIEELSASLDGEPITSGSVISADGQHLFAVAATDLCGRTDSHSSLFIIDTTAPVIEIIGVEDGDEIPPPVEISWTIDDENLVAATATLDGELAMQGIVVDQPGDHLLVIEAEDCAGNTSRTEIGFTVIEDSEPDLAISRALDSAGAILLLDRSPAGGHELEAWLAERAGRVTRVTDGCVFITELRRARHDLVVLYAPTGSIPLDTQACMLHPEIASLAAELSAMSYRRGGILVLGDGMEGVGCLGCLLDAAGADFHDHTIDQLEVEGATTIIEIGEPMTLYDLRPVDPDGGFPLLLGGGGGETTCDGIRRVTLELATDVDGPWSVDVTARTPHETLDHETGELADGEDLDTSTHPWVDLVLSRQGGFLVIDLGSADGGALPEWLALTAAVSAINSGSGTQIEASAWLATSCSLAPGHVFELFTVTAVESIGHGAGHVVAASARRYGRGEALVLPWDVVAPANESARHALEQALDFSMPSEPRRAVTGLPLPLSFTLENRGNCSLTTRLDVLVPRSELLDVWDDPVSLEPVRWEIELGGGASADRTLWISPTPDTTSLHIPYEVLLDGDGSWSLIDSGSINIEVDATDRLTELRELRIAIDDCALSCADSVIAATLRDVLAAIDIVAVAGDDRDAADAALIELANAFTAIDAETFPCLPAELRGRLADLIALWQAQWVAREHTMNENQSLTAAVVGGDSLADRRFPDSLRFGRRTVRVALPRASGLLSRRGRPDRPRPRRRTLLTDELAIERALWTDEAEHHRHRLEAAGAAVGVARLDADRRRNQGPLRPTRNAAEAAGAPSTKLLSTGSSDLW